MYPSLFLIEVFIQHSEACHKHDQQFSGLSGLWNAVPVFLACKCIACHYWILTSKYQFFYFCFILV